MTQKVVAIDGPSGAGKSTLARALASKFGFLYVDTGAIYRTLGIAALRAGVSSKDEAAVAGILPGISIELQYDERGVQRMMLGGEDVSDEIRTPQSSIYASNIAAMAPVRAFLLSMQRDIARRYDLVMDGRDIGSVVFPEAGLKIYLTAAVEMRARRRLFELREKGEAVTFESVLRDMKYRDEQDENRTVSPLVRAHDAVLADTTELSFEESLELLSNIVKERFGI